jgi:hypothetical protein
MDTVLNIALRRRIQDDNFKLTVKTNNMSKRWIELRRQERDSGYVISQVTDILLSISPLIVISSCMNSVIWMTEHRPANAFPSVVAKPFLDQVNSLIDRYFSPNAFAILFLLHPYKTESM